MTFTKKNLQISSPTMTCLTTWAQRGLILVQEIMCSIINVQSEGDVFAYVKKKDMFFATQRSEVLVKILWCWDSSLYNKFSVRVSPRLTWSTELCLTTTFTWAGTWTVASPGNPTSLPSLPSVTRQELNVSWTNWQRIRFQTWLVEHKDPWSQVNNLQETEAVIHLPGSSHRAHDRGRLPGYCHQHSPVDEQTLLPVLMFC